MKVARELWGRRTTRRCLKVPSNSVALCGCVRFILAAVALRPGEVLPSILLLQEAATSAEEPARVIMDNQVQWPVVQF